MTRAMLSQRHEAFDHLSPDVGRIDEAAFEEMVEEDPDAALGALADMASAVDNELRRLARKLAAATLIRLRSPIGQRRDLGKLGSVRAVPEGDLDLDATLARTGGLLPGTLDDVVTRTWTSAPARLVLLIDRSGSMSGAAVARAAMAAAALSLACDNRVEHGVVAFARNRIVLKHIDHHSNPAGIIDDILSLRGHGVTDVAAALEDAGRQLVASGSHGERVVVLLSDCIATEGRQPIGASPGIDRIHVVTPTDDSLEAARNIAAPTGGRVEVAASITDVGAVVASLLT